MRNMLWCIAVAALAACAATRPPVTWVWGDVDCDARVTENDVRLVQRVAVGLSILPFDSLPGDVDNNGLVNSRDALVIGSYIRGLDTHGFRVGQPMPDSPCAR